MSADADILAACRDAAARRTPPPGARVLSTLPEDERARIVRETLDRLAVSYAPCREYLLALAGGASLDALSLSARTGPDALCRRITRCRERVRLLLLRDGYVL
jgi:hypothetical protein